MIKNSNKQYVVMTSDFEPYISKHDIVTVIPIMLNKTQVYIKTTEGKTAKVEMFDVVRFCQEIMS